MQRRGFLDYRVTPRNAGNATELFKFARIVAQVALSVHLRIVYHLV